LRPLAFHRLALFLGVLVARLRLLTTAAAAERLGQAEQVELAAQGLLPAITLAAAAAETAAQLVGQELQLLAGLAGLAAVLLVVRAVQELRLLRRQ
jgi:hypothetical protein